MYQVGRGSIFFLAIGIIVAGSGMTLLAKQPQDRDVAGAIAFLSRVQGGACPGITFDPFEMSKLIDPKGLPLEIIRQRFRREFDESYREAGSRIVSEGMPAFCAVLRSLFSGKSDEMQGLVFH
jgi:hypothetical protein